jgi:hypothetical protein
MFTNIKDNYLSVWFVDIFDHIGDIWIWVKGLVIEATIEIKELLPDWTDLKDNFFSRWLVDIFDHVSDTFTWTSGQITEVGEDIKGKLPDLETAIKAKVHDIGDGIEKYVSDVGDGITETINAVDDSLHETMDGIGDSLGTSLDNLPDGFKSVFETLGEPFIEAFNPLIAAIMNYTEKSNDIEELKEDPGLVSKLLGSFEKAENAAGFGEFHTVEHESMVDPTIAKDEAWDLRKKVLAAKVGLYVIGIVAEIASAGQIEGVTNSIRAFIEGSAWDQVATQIPMIEYQAKLLRPLEYYYNREYTPEIPGPGDLVRFRVREAITQEELTQWMEFHGFAQRFSQAYWDAHWILPSPNMGYEMEAKGILTEDQLEFLLTVADYHPEWRAQMMANRFSNITRVDLRRLWQAGDISTDDMIERMRWTGFNENDSRLVAIAQIRQAQSEQTSLLLTNLKTYYTKGFMSESDLDVSLTDMELPKAQKTYHMEDAITDKTRVELEAWMGIYRDAYRKEIISLLDYLEALNELGLEEWQIDIIITSERIRKGENPFE